jgi:hypothetical protein
MKRLEAAIGIEPMNKAFAGIISSCSLKTKEAQAVAPQTLNFLICSSLVFSECR